MKILNELRILFLVVIVVSVIPGCSHSTRSGIIIRDQIERVDVPDVIDTIDASLSAPEDISAAMNEFWETLPDSIEYEGRSVTVDSQGRAVQVEVKFKPQHGNRKAQFEAKVQQGPVYVPHKDTTAWIPPIDLGKAEPVQSWKEFFEQKIEVALWILLAVGILYGVWLIYSKKWIK